MLLSTQIFGAENRPRDVVLLHGTGAHGDMWRNQIPILVEQGFRCIVPDLRGHGKTVEPGGRADIEAHICDILETLQAMDITFPAIFAGHSLGAIISLELAQQHPDMVKKVLAVSMPGRVPGVTSEAFKWFLGWPYHGIKQTQVHRYLGWRERTLMETDKRALEQVMLNFKDLDYCSNRLSVQCPVHFVVGRLDPVAPFFHAETLHKGMPESTLQILEWAGHNCMDSQPQAFNKWLVEKLN
jgi:pimeloyl-ACP methyl ester carboxylesterase